MELKVTEDYNTMSVATAAMFIDCIRSKPNALICFASGDTPKLAYQLVAEMLQREDIDISQLFFIGLDEWLGIPPGNTGSCHYFLQHYLFQPSGIDAAQTHLFDALTSNEEQECETMNNIIAQRGGIDLMIVGVGMNGHIGFNEPGADIDSNAHVIELDAITKTVGQKYFQGGVTISKGITIGLKQVMQAKTLLMIANGHKKAPVIKKAVEEEISTNFPASLIRQHKNSVLLIDTEAASELSLS